MIPNFQIADLGIVGVLILLEGLLSADNALVLALLVRHLPEECQKKALLYGLFGAFILRGIEIYFAGVLMGLWWVCGLGSAYLVYLGAKHFWGAYQKSGNAHAPTRPSTLGFWPTVAVVELTDIVFAVDSILVAVALVNDPAKIWIVYAGGFMGIILLRLAASVFIGLIDRFPSLDHLAYGLVAWAGLKLASSAVDIWHLSHRLPEPHLLPKWAFWVGFALIIALGVVYALRHPSPKLTPPPGPRTDEHGTSLHCLTRGGFLYAPPGPKS